MSVEVLVSFIVPAYNMEDYIEECLDSLLQVKISKEIIVVNDGSKDSTEEKVRQLMTHNSSIIFLNQENQGQARARNHALDQASGQYIYFVDADDYIYPDHMTEFINNVVKHSLDVGVTTFDNQKSLTIQKKYYPEMELAFKGGIISGLDFMERTLKAGSYGAEVCLYMFKRELLGSLRFPVTMKKHEDDNFMPQALKLAKSVGFNKNAVYFRRYRENSVSRSVDAKPSRSPQDILFNIKTFLAHAEGGEKNSKVFATLALRSLVSYIDYCRYSGKVGKEIWTEYRSISLFGPLLKWKIKFYKLYLNSLFRS